MVTANKKLKRTCTKMCSYALCLYWYKILRVVVLHKQLHILHTIQ